MQVIQEYGGGRVTLISEDKEDHAEISFLCDLVDALENGGEIMVNTKNYDRGICIVTKKQNTIIRIPQRKRRD